MEGWIGRKSCRKTDLESLVGRLCHASRVVPDPSQASNHLTATSSTAGLVDRKSVKEGCINVVGSNNNVFFGFLRAGEVVVPSDSAFDPSVHLSITDISMGSRSSPTYIAVNIEASKTDPFWHGMTIYLG